MSEQNKPTEEVKEEFDVTERCAFLMDQEYPKQLAKVIKILEKRRPGGVGRLLFNIVLDPFNGQPLLGADEKAAMDLIKEILASKRIIMDYTINERIKADELAKQENSENTVDETENK